MHEKYISSGGKFAKLKLTKYDIESKSRTPPPPQDSGCLDRVLLCYAAVARFLLLVPGSWSLVTLTSSAIISAPSPRHLHLTAQSARPSTRPATAEDETQIKPRMFLLSRSWHFLSNKSHRALGRRKRLSWHFLVMFGYCWLSLAIVLPCLAIVWLLFGCCWLSLAIVLQLLATVWLVLAFVGYSFASLGYCLAVVGCLWL